jgi:UDP-N-acetylmuramate dehydrogenase
MREKHRKELKSIAGRDVCFDRPLRLYTTFRIGGNAAALLRARTLESLKRVIAYIADHDVPWLMIGKGSNLLISDQGFDGVVIKLMDELASPAFSQGKHQLVVGGGTPNRHLLGYCVKNGLGGLEFLAGIPGTSGGAVVMNAGALGSETGEFVDRVEVMMNTGKVEEITAGELEFGYRKSKIPYGAIVTKIYYKVRSENPSRVAEMISENIAVRRRVQPHGLPSAGSVFKNPEGDYAGRLIEMAGLKGKRIGGALISPVNANWIVNTGDATAADILELMEFARDAVRRRSGIELVSEIQTIGM